MKIKENYVLQTIGDDYIVVPIAEEADRLHGIISLTETGAYLWRRLMEGIDTKSQLENALIQEYNISQDLAHNDVDAFVLQLESIGCLEDCS